MFGPGVDEPIVAYDKSGVKSWLISDERGSIVAITNASGAQTAINGYDEYGLPDADPVSGADRNTGRFRYTGQVWLDGLGVYYYKNRIYSPTIGRFFQTDPIGYGDGINWYAYAHNDPVNGSDPLGLDCTVRGGSVCPVVGAGTVTVWGTGSGGCSISGSTSIGACTGGNIPLGSGSVGDDGSFAPGIPTGLQITPPHVNPPDVSDPCNPAPDTGFFEKGLTGLAIVGDAFEVGGEYTANPVALGIGTSLKLISAGGSIALHYWEGDGWGIGIDAVSIGASLLPGAQLARRLGGARADFGRTAGGQFKKNWRNLEKAQNKASQAAQELGAQATFNSARCAR